MKLAYVSGPYRSGSVNGIYHNIHAAREVASQWWGKGYAVICPHMNTAFLDGSCDDGIWLAGDIEILSRCDVIIMMPNWPDSEGARKEHDFAKQHGLHVVYL